VPAGRAPRECEQGISPGFSPRPAAARESTGADPTALTPKAGLPQPCCSPWAPLFPPMLLTPLQGPVVPLHLGYGTAVAAGYSQRTAPVSSGKCSRGESPAGSWSLVPGPRPVPGSVELVLAWLPPRVLHRCWGRCSLRISTTRPLKQSSITEQAAGKDS